MVANPLQLKKLSFYKWIWWTWGGSNPRPHRCERCALPTELHAHRAFILTNERRVTKRVRNKFRSAGTGTRRQRQA
jgi:hypothetical protein